MEAGLLIERLTSWVVALRCSPDSFNSDRGLGRRRSIWIDKAALYFRCQGRGVFLCMEGALHVSFNYYYTAWNGHLELEISIVWHRIESSKRGSSKQCVIATAEGDNIED